MNFFGFFMHGGGDDVIDLAPLVDIAFLLLTFFMMTTTFAPQEVLKVETPKSSSSLLEPVKQYITVTVGDSTKEGQIRVYMDEVNTRIAALSEKYGEAKARSTEGIEVARIPNPNDSIEVNKAIAELRDVLMRARLADAKQTVVLKADKQVKFSIIYKIMTTMKSVNFEQVQMVTTMER
ncbi:MAG: biopolymer transporter ExbD [Chloroherpetonaceae bacterium]|nr:biopolymer transporter ExbD [Chloroherpetonaceae bacterium]MDW8437095.1 biopolymer transporter ExbD [Chloroherpetonaceae bacterium]